MQVKSHYFFYETRSYFCEHILLSRILGKASVINFAELHTQVRQQITHPQKLGIRKL